MEEPYDGLVAVDDGLHRHLTMLLVEAWLGGDISI